MTAPAPTAPIMVGPIPMETDADAPIAGGDPGPDNLWGMCPHTGDAVFVALERPVFRAEIATPWSAVLWTGWEDGHSAPNDIGEPRYATRDDALAAMRAAVAARP